MKLLNGARAVITGGGASVGRACVEVFQQHGAKVAFLEIDATLARDTEQATGAKGYVVDIADKAAVEAAIADAARWLGGITVLVNQASQCFLNVVHNQTDEEFERTIDVNLKGHFYCSRAAIPHMLAAGKGAIVDISSVAATNPGWAESTYCAAKAAQIVLNKEVAMDYGPIIRANSLAVGWIRDSPTSNGIQQIPELIDPIWDEHLSGRAGESWEIANAALFFASDLSSYVTGQ
ncbi:MAG TPA: SDR family oxidoreductase, partial [Spongiibacteraceae bacterium]|nr:SDR family oxidoreductase [Spongiibacteraceae bacterium]